MSSFTNFTVVHEYKHFGYNGLYRFCMDSGALGGMALVQQATFLAPHTKLIQTVQHALAISLFPLYDSEIIKINIWSHFWVRQ